MRILLVSDRSGGHIFPALVLAKRLKVNNDVYFFATAKFLKSYLLKEGFYVLGRSFDFRNLILEGFYRFFEALYIIIFKRPKKIIGFGGRDSFFLILFGSILCIDTFIYEPNTKIGRANKVLSFFVKKIFLGFPDTFYSKKTVAVGIPLRDNIKRISLNEAKKILNLKDAPVVFFFGGSQGSSFINTIAMRFASEMKNKYQIVHITGKKEYFEIKEFYNKINKNIFVKDFFYNLELIYSVTSVVVCRAGACSLAEIFYYNLPAILIPHPSSTRHQEENAFYFGRRGASVVFLQNKFSFEKFKKVVEEILLNEDFKETLKDNLRKIKLTVNVEEFYNKICDFYS